MSTLDRLEKTRQRYARLKPGWAPATAVYQQRVAAALSKGNCVLDLGCGRGGIVERLADSGAWLGVDPDIQSLQQHRSATLARGCAQSESLPFAAQTFDMIVASWVLEHLDHPRATFGEIGRLLRPGGSFFFLTPNARHPLSRLNAIIARMQPLHQQFISTLYERSPADTFPVTYRANTIRSIEYMAIGAGLQLVEIALIDDPAYLALGPWALLPAVALEMILPALCKVHLVGHFVKRPPAWGA